jgi:hypothetical protein
MNEWTPPPIEAQPRLTLGASLYDIVAEDQALTPRSQQKRLGPSQLGYCKAYIQNAATDAPALPDPGGVKLGAAWGTAIGDYLEGVVGRRIPGTLTQLELEYALPNAGFTVRGSCDILIPRDADSPFADRVVDLKSKDGLEEVRKDSTLDLPAQFEYLVQISVYLLAGIDQGLLTENAIGELVFVDRSASDKTTHTVAIDVTEARRYIQMVEESMVEIERYEAEGKLAPRQNMAGEPMTEQTCWYFGCPFYNTCWSGYLPHTPAPDAEAVRLTELYVEGREIEKRGANMKRAAKASMVELLGYDPNGPAMGFVTDRHFAQTVERVIFGRQYTVLDVRARREEWEAAES